MKKTRAFGRIGAARVGALLVILGSGWTSPPPASAQLGGLLGSLIIEMTAPGPGSTLRGTVPVSASVTIIGSLTVAGVQFKLDGADLGAEDTTAPYSVSWNTALSSNGSHTLTAVARDILGVRTTSNAVTVVVDNAPPTVTINQAAGQADPARTAPVSFTVVFGEPVSGFTSGDVAITGTAGGSKTVSVSGGPATYSVAVSGMTDGTVVAAVVAGAVQDAAGNPSLPSTTGDDTVTFDATPPAVTIDQAPGQADPTDAAPIRFTVGFAEPVSGFTAADVTLGGTAGGARTVAVTGGPAAYDVAVSDVTDGTLIATIAAGVALDASGNANLGSTSTDNSVTVQTSVPTLNRIEDTSDAVTFTGGWMEGYTGPYAWSGGTAALGFTAGHVAELAFNGTGVSWIGFRGPQTGIARVLVDGTLRATVDPYAPSEQVGAVLFSESGLANGPHTLRIEATGTSNPASSDRFVVVDAFDVAGLSGPDTTPPTVSVTSPAAGATVSGSVSVSASAADDVGVAGVQFLLDGAPLGAEDTTAPFAVTWDTTAAADGAHDLTAVARDAAGHATTSVLVTVTVSNAAPPPTATVTRFEQTEPSVTWTDGIPAAGRPDKWWYGSRSRGWSGGTSSFNRSQGARATFTFTGTSVRWIGFRAHWAGIAMVSVDGGPPVEIDLFNPPNPADRENGEEDQAVVFTATGLAPGGHTLAVESTGRKRGGDTCDPAADPANCASDWAVVVDAFDVAPSTPPPVAGTRSEETALAYAPATSGAAWTAGDTSKPWSGGTAAVHGGAGARATYVFTGTTVRWIGFRGPRQGIARVFLDGGLQAEVDTYAPDEAQAVVFTAQGLVPARHELTIEVTGLRNAAAQDSLVVVDAFDVRTRFEDRDPSITYAGEWIPEDAGKAWSGTAGTTGSGTAALGRTAGGRATFAFSGTSVRWIGYRGPLGGLADVFVDDAFAERIDLYAAGESVGVPVFTRAGLADGAHTLRIEVTGEKNPSAAAAFVIVDAFDVTPPSSVPTVQRRPETDPAIVYTSSSDWTRGSRFRYDSGEFAMGSHGADLVPRAGARATFRFTGASVRWIGRRGFATGVAHVSLDGVRVATIDTRVPLTSQEEFQAPVFAAGGLDPALEHTLEIELAGRNGEPAGSPVEHPVWVDAFDVY